MKEFGKSGLGLALLYIAFIPIGFKVSLYLNILFDLISKHFISLFVVCGAYILIGLLCGIFVIVLNCIENRLRALNKKGGIIIISIQAINILLGFSTLIGINIAVLNGHISFNYFDNPRYVIVISMLMCFSIVKSMAISKKGKVRK